MIFGISIAVSAINLFFRDIERIITILTTLLFYVTPIIYSEEMVPPEYKALLLLNPLSVLMVNWRTLFMKGIIDFGAVALSLVYSLVILAAGYVIFRKLRWKFAEVL